MQKNEDIAWFEDQVRAAPDVQLRPYRVRSAPDLLDLLYQAVVFAANIGGFLGFCAICRNFLEGRPRYQIELSYRDENGAQHTSTFTSASADQIDTLLQLHLPNTRDGVRLRIQRPTSVAASNAG